MVIYAMSEITPEHHLITLHESSWVIKHTSRVTLYECEYNTRKCKSHLSRAIFIVATRTENHDISLVATVMVRAGFPSTISLNRCVQYQYNYVPSLKLYWGRPRSKLMFQFSHCPPYHHPLNFGPLPSLTSMLRTCKVHSGWGSVSIMTHWCPFLWEQFSLTPLTGKSLSKKPNHKSPTVNFRQQRTAINEQMNT